MTLMKRVREFVTSFSNPTSRRIIQIGTKPTNRLRLAPTNSWSRSDYKYWNKLYYCQIRGLELSGLFFKPLVNKITSWTLGRAPRWKCSSQQNQIALTTWWRQNHRFILRIMRSALRRGDAFVVINSDLTVSLIDPSLVDPIVDPNDFGKVIGWRVTQVLQHPTETTRRMTVIDEYYADRRVHRKEEGLKVLENRTFRNLLGRMTFMHISNNVEDGNIFGKSEALPLIEVLQRYGEVLEAAVDGNKSQGRPTPVASFETIQDLEKFWELYGQRETQEDVDGESETVSTLDVDLSQLITLSGAQFDYKSPGSFTEDTVRLLEIMFYLILEHLEIPEFVMGNAISSSKASADTQMPVFETFITSRRTEITPWIEEIGEIVLGYKSFLEPGVTAERPVAQWQRLTQDGRLTLDTLIWALSVGLIDRETALVLAPLEIENVDEVLDNALKEYKARQEQINAQFQAQQVKNAQRGPVKEMDEELADELRSLVN